MKTFLFILLFFSSVAFAQEDQALDELLEEENYEEAIVVLKERFLDGPVNIEDILLLGRIYEGLGFNKKAIKTYLFGITKLHSSSWKEIKNFRQLKEILPDLKEPKKQVLLLAYKVGVHYYDLSLVTESSEELNRRILETSLKYLLICEQFSFSLQKTKFFVGMIYKEYEDFKKSSLKFLDVWELFEKQKTKDKESDQKIKLMLGESFINYGHIVAGTSYLRSAYYYKNGSKYFRDYASEYLDEFLGSSVGASVGLSAGNDSNVLIGNSIGDEAVTASQYTDKSASIFLGHSPSYSNHYNFSISFNEELYTESALKDNDSRSLSFSSSWAYKKFERTILTTSYLFSRNYSRPTAAGEFEAESNYHQISFSWQRVFRRALFSISLPFNRTTYETGSQSDSKGLGFVYSYVSFSKYWVPSGGIDFSVQEEEGFKDSKNFMLSLSNSFNISDLLGASIDFSFEINSNSSDSLAYTERVLGFNLYYSFEKIDGLSVEGSISSEANTPSLGNKDTRLKIGLGLSYVL